MQQDGLTGLLDEETEKLRTLFLNKKDSILIVEKGPEKKRKQAGKTVVDLLNIHKEPNPWFHSKRIKVLKEDFFLATANERNSLSTMMLHGYLIKLNPEQFSVFDRTCK